MTLKILQFFTINQMRLSLSDSFTPRLTQKVKQIKSLFAKTDNSFLCYAVFIVGYFVSFLC